MIPSGAGLVVAFLLSLFLWVILIEAVRLLLV
jgi:hypothetical protein